MSDIQTFAPYAKRQKFIALDGVWIRASAVVSISVDKHMPAQDGKFQLRLKFSHGAEQLVLANPTHFLDLLERYQ